jgi:hypothetical protein
MRRGIRGVAAVFVLASVALAGCKDDGGGAQADDFNQEFRQGDRSSSVCVGESCKVPADFPSSAIPLPGEGALQAIVTGKSGDNGYYTLTYGLGGRNGVTAGADYRRRLENAGFDIRNQREESGTETGDTGFTSFDAIGNQWDVFVVSGRANRGERPALSIQVSTHGTLAGLGEDTLLDPGASSVPEDTTGTTLPPP